MRILKPQLILALLLTLILSVQGAFGISVSGSCGDSGWESSTNLDFDAPTNGGVDGVITLADGITYPTVSGSGDFDPTWTVSDPTGRKATVYANVIGSTTFSWEGYLDYNDNGGDWTINPAGETIAASSDSSYLEAYQHLVTSGATSVYAYAEASPAGTTPDRYARVSLKIDGNGNANVRQTATALDTLAIAMQRGTAGGNTVVTTAEASQDASNYYSLTRTATGISTLGFYDTAVADTTDSIDGYKAEIITSKLSGTVSIEDHRITNGAEQKVALTNSVKTGTMASKNTGSIINDMVNSACTGSGATITIASGKYNENIKIDKSLTLAGESSTSKPVIDGTGLTSGSLITIGNSKQDISVMLSNLELTKGTAGRGAAVSNYATGTTSGAGVPIPGLTLTDSYIHDNYAASGAGAGLYNKGSAYVSNTVFDKNVISSKGSQGGAIFTYSGLTVKDCTITNNFAAYGSGIYVATSAEIIGGTISNNGYSSSASCTNGGGISIMQGATATVSGTTVKDNRATVGAGINNYGTLKLNGATISGNIASSGAGGIYNYYGATIIANTATTTITGNTAPPNLGGGVLNRGAATGKDYLTSTSNIGGNWIGNACT
jgi:hypothetical protein